MGIALADAAYKRGADVIFIAGYCSEKIPDYLNTIKAGTTLEMYGAVMDNLEKADIIIKAAAPADYRTAYSDNKIKDKDLILKFEKNPDIAAAAGAKKGNKKLIIFCAETEDLINNAKKKLAAKNADMVVANNVLTEGAGFNTDTNIVALIYKDKAEQLGIMKKTVLADIILDRINEL